MRRHRAASVFLAAMMAVALGFGTGLPGMSENGAFLPGQGGSIALAENGACLLVVNPDSNSVSFLSTDALGEVTEVEVGVNPRSVAVNPISPLAYVANQGSDSISVISLEARAVIETVRVGFRPVGVAVSIDGSTLAVSEFGQDSVRLVDTATLRTRASVPTADRPYSVAFTLDGRWLLVTHLLSGAVTFIDLSDLSTQTVVTWANVAPAPGVTINEQGTRAYLPQTTAHGQQRNTQFDNTVFAKVSVLDLVSREHLTAEHVSLPEKDQPVGLPWAVALARGGRELWVVNAASNDVSVINIEEPERPRRVAHVLVSSNPRGIVISPDGTTAFVSNTLAGTVSVIDTARYAVVKEVTVTEIPLPPVLLSGKRLFYLSARPDVARAAWISCNTCHIEGEQDGRTWLLQYLGEVLAGADPVVKRNTTSLLGMVETYPLRWSAEWDESADSEFSIRFEQFGTGLIHDGEMNPTLGNPNSGRSHELDCLAAYIDSLAVPAQVHLLSEQEERGKLLFESERAGCSVCHPGPTYTDLKQHDVGTADGPNEWFGPKIDTPTLRFLYDSAPYFHDGSAATLRDALTFPSVKSEHDVRAILSEAELADLIAFLKALPYGGL
jgi:YVTN family beta-propeller protein